MQLEHRIAGAELTPGFATTMIPTAGSNGVFNAIPAGPKLQQTPGRRNAASSLVRKPDRGASPRRVRARSATRP